MKVRVVRRGGLAGVPVSTTVDSDELPPAALAALQGAVGRPAAPPRGADAFTYEFTLGEGAAATSAVLHEHELPPELGPLLDRLAEDGLPGR